MEKSGERQNGHGNTVRVVTGLGAAGVTAAAAGVAYYRHRRHQTELGNREVKPGGRRMEERAAILHEPRLKADVHAAINEVAARVYLAKDSQAGVLVRDELLAAMPDTKRRVMNTALRYLQERQLIEQDKAADDSGRNGYKAIDALDFAAKQGETYPDLSDALLRLTADIGEAGYFDESGVEA